MTSLFALGSVTLSLILLSVVAKRLLPTSSASEAFAKGAYVTGGLFLLVAIMGLPLLALLD